MNWNNDDQKSSSVFKECVSFFKICLRTVYAENQDVK